MTGVIDHRAEAERLLGKSEDTIERTTAQRTQFATQAQVHATLALLDAVRTVAYEPMDPADFARIRRELGEERRAQQSAESTGKPAGRTWTGGLTMTDEPRMVTYDVPMRLKPPRFAQLTLPADLTAAEAERIAALIKAVAFEESTLDRLARKVAMPLPSVPWSEAWETATVEALKAAGIQPTKEILDREWKLAQRISTAQQSPVPWSADWEQEVVNELKTAGVHPTKEIIGQVWQLASTGASTSAQASKAARAWLDSRHSPPYPPHIRISKPGDVCWCGARIGGPGEQSRAHRPATQEELADDPGRAE